MDGFNFAFTLFGLLLGLSLAEVLTGFARALKGRRMVNLGLLTPMLALFVMLDLISFWQWTWGARDYLTPHYGILTVGLLVSGLYYLAASIVFPAEFGERADFDEHYRQHHRQIFAAIIVCNLVGTGWANILLFDRLPVRVIVELGLYYALLVTGLVASGRQLHLVVLGGLIALYLVAAVMSFVHPPAS